MDIGDGVVEVDVVMVVMVVRSGDGGSRQVWVCVVGDGGSWVK